MLRLESDPTQFREVPAAGDSRAKLISPDPAKRGCLARAPNICESGGQASICEMARVVSSEELQCFG